MIVLFLPSACFHIERRRTRELEGNYGLSEILPAERYKPKSIQNGNHIHAGNRGNILLLLVVLWNCGYGI